MTKDFVDEAGKVVLVDDARCKLGQITVKDLMAMTLYLGFL
jgi:hypothetical protein